MHKNNTVTAETAVIHTGKMPILSGTVVAVGLE
jgi:hypothetical protein